VLLALAATSSPDAAKHAWVPPRLPADLATMAVQAVDDCHASCEDCQEVESEQNFGRTVQQLVFGESNMLALPLRAINKAPLVQSCATLASSLALAAQAALLQPWR